MLAEQLVAQELIAYSDPYQPYELFWWHRSKRGSTAEVDFVIAHNAIILPIEVKAGEIGNLRSMKIFMEEKNHLLEFVFLNVLLLLSKIYFQFPFT